MKPKTIDKITTILGLIAGTSALLGSTGVIGETTAGTIGGVAVAILGYFVRQPQTSAKSSEDSF